MTHCQKMNIIVFNIRQLQDLSHASARNGDGRAFAEMQTGSGALNDRLVPSEPAAPLKQRRSRHHRRFAHVRQTGKGFLQKCK
jgi:hypothetical protein